MVKLEQIIEFFKPAKKADLGDLTDNKTLTEKDYNLIYLDCTKKYETFTKFFKSALDSLDDKGVLVINGAYPKYMAYQSPVKCGMVWFWLMMSGYKYRTFDDGNLGLAVLSKEKEKIDQILPDFLEFSKNVKPNKLEDLEVFKPKKRTRRKKAE